MEILSLDETTHTYTLGCRKFISVTQALSILDDRWKIDPWYLERGRLVHLATAYFDRDELDQDTIDPQIKGYFNGYMSFLKDTGFKPQLIEHRLYHKRYGYAGTMDRIGPLNDKQALIDLKSGTPARIDGLQLAAYWELCRANDIPIQKIFDLYLNEDGTYKLEPIEKPKLLLPIFLACLQITQWKETL